MGKRIGRLGQSVQGQIEEQLPWIQGVSLERSTGDAERTGYSGRNGDRSITVLQKRLA